MADNDKASMHLESWALGIGIAAFLLSCFSLFLDYTDSRFSGWFSPRLSYASYVLLHVEMPRRTNMYIVVANEGNEAAKDVFIQLSDLPKETDETNVAVPGYPFAVERVNENELLLRIESIPTNDMAVVYVRNLLTGRTGRFPQIDRVYSEHGSASFREALTNRGLQAAMSDIELDRRRKGDEEMDNLFE